ncbi:MAG: hypothetical protein ACR2RB_07705 [Gammaproteobacteria bacterium]
MIKQSVVALACVVLLAGCGGGGSVPENSSSGGSGSSGSGGSGSGGSGSSGGSGGSSGGTPPPPPNSTPPPLSQPPPFLNPPPPGSPPVVSDDPPKAPAGVRNATMTLFDAYSQTVFPVMSQNCGDCHSQNIVGQTAHSGPNAQTAFNVIFGQNGDGAGGSRIVDPIRAARSVAVTRPDPGMHDGCGVNCPQVSDAIEAAIVNMAERNGIGGPAALDSFQGALLGRFYNFSFQGVRNADGTIFSPAAAETIVRGDFASLASPIAGTAQNILVYTTGSDDTPNPNRIGPGPNELVAGIIFGGADANAVGAFSPLPAVQNVFWGHSLTMVEANLGLAYDAVQQAGNITEFVIFFPERHIVIAFRQGHVQHYGLYNPQVVTAENRIDFLVAAKIDVLNMGNSQ